MERSKVTWIEISRSIQERFRHADHVNWSEKLPSDGDMLVVPRAPQSP